MSPLVNMQKILIWLPSPLGDVIMATPALRAFRSLFPDAHITFLATPFTRQILSGGNECDGWIDYQKDFRGMIKTLKSHDFDAAILLKNSFGSALTLRLAKIPRRIGYARDGRSFLLTDRIGPLRNEDGTFKPAPMTDYYLKIAEHLGAAADDRKPRLSVTPENIESMHQKLPRLATAQGPSVILVPGGAFGPSKLWAIDRYAALADKLHEIYQATVILSIAPVPEEIEIVSKICNAAQSDPVHIGNSQLDGSELKALFSEVDLVITNDTGPRHIAIALDKNTVSLFGPNNPQWTQTGHEKEIQIIGQGPCVPCDKPVCRQSQHLCMDSITVEAVLEAASHFLESAV